MFDYIFPESQLVSGYYGEYLEFIKRYENFNRQGIFCRYINVNKAASNFNAEATATQDRYNSGIRYDVYDLTPTFIMSQLVDEMQETSDLTGQMIQGMTQATIYTIKEPRIDDIMIFKYAPQKGEEIFRVNHIRSMVHAMRSSPNVNWFEVNLEYAPMIDTSKIQYINHYIYNLSQERYLLYNDFERMINDTQLMNQYLKHLSEHNYSLKHEMYYYVDSNGRKIIPIKLNKILYDFLTSDRKHYTHMFNNVRRPFGIRFEEDMIGSINADTGEYINYEPPLPTFTKLKDFTTVPTLMDIAVCIIKWEWDERLEYYPDPKHNISQPEVSNIIHNLDSAYPNKDDGEKNLNLNINVDELPIKGD